jgi:hypothetical protein
MKEEEELFLSSVLVKIVSLEEEPKENRRITNSHCGN